MSILDEVVERAELQRLDTTAHEVLKSIYQDPNQPISLRCRAAIKAIEVETPKVMAVAHGYFDGQTFAERLLAEERCFERSRSPVPRLNGPVEPLPLEEAKKPFPRSYRRV